MTGRTARRRIVRIAASGDAAPGGSRAAVLSHRPDLLAAEEPLEIRVNGRPLAVTMRTPGDDIDLAAGFLAGEGLVHAAADITEIRICRENHDGHRHDGAPPGRAAADDRGHGNLAEVTLARAAAIDEDGLRRNFLTTSACGVCGKASIDAIRVQARYDVSADQVRVRADVLARLPAALREAQRIFARTGGLHAAGAFAADGT
ncbi:MAG TPA: formate dehydrogenase accessory sulfurtransferase FdhD, partial [Streptosporangiaceae bacterium]